MPSASRPRATVIGAFVEGWRRVLRAPAVTASLFTAALVLGLPLAVPLHSILEPADIGLPEGAAAGDDLLARVQELTRPFLHELVGFGGTLTTSGDWLARAAREPIAATPAVTYVALWLFLSGGILDRFARARPIRTAAFFAACGVYFVRFLRLSVIAAFAYYLLFLWMYPFLYVHLFDHLTQGLSLDPTWIRVVLGIVFGLALFLVSVVMDFAKVRAVVEDRRGMLGAVAASIRFMRRRPMRVLSLYVLNVIALLLVFRLWLLAMPGPDTSAWSALFLTLLFLLARIWARLAFMASEVVFFQGELAHREYTAAPMPIWPDAPEVEALENLASQKGEG
jgi:hypothetical protein